MASWYPIFLSLQGRACVVVGGGEVAERKVDLLLRAGAAVTVISPALSPGLASRQEQITCRPRPYRRGDLAGAALAFAATDDPATNAAVADEARASGIPVNVADEVGQCTFLVPALVERGDLAIAISTGGASPALAKRLRQELEARFGPAYGDFVAFLGALRQQVLRDVRDPARRHAILERAASPEIFHLVTRGPREEFQRHVEDLLATVSPAPHAPGQEG